MDWKQRALYNLMSEVSEDCWCAGWMMGNEFVLWSMVADPSSPRRYGQDSVSEEAINDMRAIAQEIGGWIYWHDDTHEPNLPSSEWGPRFIPMQDWLERYKSA